MPTLLWFRRDLRLYDLPPLLDAADADGEALACYVLDPRLQASAGPRRLQYLYDALRAGGLGGRVPHERARLDEREGRHERQEGDRQREPGGDARDPRVGPAVRIARLPTLHDRLS